jgi:hypothetical protein
VSPSKTRSNVSEWPSFTSEKEALRKAHMASQRQKEAVARGYSFEQRVADTLGGVSVPQSGGGKFWKSDVKDKVFIWYCKATEKDYFRFTKRMLDEALVAVKGALSVGDSACLGLAFELDGEAFVALRLDDFADLAAGEVDYVPSAKALSRRQRANKRPFDK